MPESIANAELDASMNEDSIAPSSTSNGATLETNNDDCSSMTIGDLADGKQPISRTVVMDLLVRNLFVSLSSSFSFFFRRITMTIFRRENKILQQLVCLRCFHMIYYFRG